MTDPNLARRILRPHDCVLALALPTSQDEFQADLYHQDKEFARRFGFWEDYRQQVADSAAKQLCRIAKLGTRIVRQVTLAEFGRLFREDFTAIILMAHWKDPDAVELADGFAKVDAIVGEIPPDATRILDLGVCHPSALTGAVRRERPRCLVRHTATKATPAIWFYFYFFVMHQLRYEELTYLEAVENVIRHMREASDG